jgi:putative radical SAM enzyme (TIGR03279 family)
MKVTRVVRDGAAARADIENGDELLAVGGLTLQDSLDLTFALGWLEGPNARYDLSRQGRRFSVTMPLAGPEELGLELEEPRTRTCGNACVFCFVDQLPTGLRPSLYVKDEDYRLSFSYGNYITLTNLTEGDYERIRELRLSPLYVSVHATDDEVRRVLLGVDDAPPILEALGRLGDAGIRIHAQVVLVPGLNDREVLERTLADLHGLGRTIESVAVVPVGLTAYREGLPPLSPVSQADAERALDTIERWQETYLREDGARRIYASDELYLRAGREPPPYADYDDFPQLENGVGLLRTFEHALMERTRELREELLRVLARARRPLTVTIVTGELAAPFVERSLEKALGGLDALELEVATASNRLLGPGVTVAGLLAGADMVAAIAALPPSDLTLLPRAAFNENEVTLDGRTVSEIGERAGRENVVATDDIIEEIARALERVGAEGSTRAAE